MYTQDQNELIMQSQSFSSTWTSNDHTMFLNALVNGPDDIVGRWQELADAIPGKTAEEVKAYYETVERELLEIEAGRVELPHYPDDDEDVMGDEFVVRVKKEDESVGDSDSGLLANGFGSKRREKERKKATPWTEEEHRKFLQGLEVYGKGDWRSISRIMVVTRTATQVASHAQKYFLRQASLKEDNNNNEENDNNKKKKKKRRRCSIHDITTADAPAVVQGQPSSSTPPTASSLNGSQGRGRPAATTSSSPIGGQFNGGRGRGRRSLELWPGMQAITTDTVVVHAQPISSAPPATSFYDSNGRIVPPLAATTPSSPYVCGGEGGAPQPLDSFYGGNEGGVPPHPTLPPMNGYGEQGGAPLRYEFIKHLAPNHVRDYTLDEEFGFRNCYFNE